jgi:glutamate-ammonia-ligase adenylyltransferase
LLGNVGNIALLLNAEKEGLLPEGTGQAAGSAYRALRRVQHRARLDEQPTQVAPEEVEKECAAIQALWHAVFASP